MLTKTQAIHTLFALTAFLTFLVKPVKVDAVLDGCGQLSVESLTVLGRNVTFFFTPETFDQNANLSWHRKNDNTTDWSTLAIDDKFQQIRENTTYNLLLTNSDKDDEQIYRVRLCNGTNCCTTESGKLVLKGNACGLILLRTKKIIRNETIKIAYYPPNSVLDFANNFTRQWVHFNKQTSTLLTLEDGRNEEEMEQGDIYVLTIVSFQENMTGDYWVNCGDVNTNNVTLEFKEPPSLPIIQGLQDIENCTDCIVGEVKDKVNVSCVIHNGSRPLQVTMTIGSEFYTLDPFNGTSTSYLKFLELRDRHHMETISFSVNNDALTSPLIVTSKVYIIKSPSFQLFVPETLKEGKAVIFKCSVYEGRPSPNVYFNISGSILSSESVQTIVSSDKINTYLTTFKREWNGKNFSCCLFNKWYKNKQECSPPQQVDYLFPPSKVKIAVKFDAERQGKLFAECTVYDSNPVCNVKFSSIEKIFSEKQTTHYRLPFGAWNSVYRADLNISQDDIGTTLTCTVDCTEFPVDLKDTVKIYLPSPPTIKFNISGSVLKVTKGKEEHVECLAESFPASNISWTEELSNRNVTKKICDMASKCILTINSDSVSERVFTCFVNYLKIVDHKRLTVHITENSKEKEDYRRKDNNSELAFNKLVIWIILGSCLFVTGTIFAVFLLFVFKKRRQSSTEKKECRVRYFANLDTISRNPRHSLEEGVQRNLNVDEHEHGNEVPVYSKPLKKRKKGNEGSVILNVKNPENPAGSSEGAQAHRVEDGHLVYAELEFDPNENQGKLPIVRRKNSLTEYADVDYVKTIAEKTVADNAEVQENIYANQ